MVARGVLFFQRQVAEVILRWQHEFQKFRDQQSRVVIWGAGSKAVSFLNTIGVADVVQYVVDVNPHRQGTYMAGTGQLVVSPEFLIGYNPDTILVMNEVYLEEIRRYLAFLGLDSKLYAVCGKSPAASQTALHA